MAIFGCVGCGEPLTAPVSEVVLPAGARSQVGNGILLPVLMVAGTFAVDPEPSGPPWRVWEEIDAAKAAARGVFAPVYHLSFGAPGAIVIAPGDTRGTVLVPEWCEGYCCGLTEGATPNMACARCGRPVATRVDDCSLWQAVWLDPGAVRRLPGGAGDEPVVDWDTWVRERGRDPQPDPVARSYWRWGAAAGAALAHLLVASGGAPLELPEGPAARAFAPALRALLPAGPPSKRVVLAGPGLPRYDSADLALVPQHPQTGEVWQPHDDTTAVPLAADAWLYLAFPDPHQVPPATGGLPPGVWRDDPALPHPGALCPDRGIFLRTLARLPAVREPWLRKIHGLGWRAW
ncbi:hypothetical protein [Streptomyces sp. NPDC048442]|uniref:hypothetical protein n=1 Tax=Streptomyces sp. NPDC048442 TaxID=3154823 RepID=UPI003436C466